MRRHSRTAVISAIGITAALLLTGCTQHQTEHSNDAAHSTQSSVPADAGAPTADVPENLPEGWTPADVRFTQMMIPHHQQAVDAAEVVLANPAVSDRLRTHAQEVLTSQQAEIDTMTGWLTAAGLPVTPLGADPHAGHEGHGMNTMDNDVLASIDNPDELDAEWARQMIPHHQGALTMAKDVLDLSNNAEVRTLAITIIDAQEAEIDMLNGWLPAE